MKVLPTPDDAVLSLPRGARVLLPPGCGEPAALVDALVRNADRLEGIHIQGGYTVSDARWLDPELPFRWTTYHYTPKARALEAEGRAHYAPIRYFDMLTEFAPGGAQAADAILVQVSEPDPGGRYFLGVSSSYPWPLAKKAPLVIAQINPLCPQTPGPEGFLTEADIDISCRAETPVLEYSKAKGTPEEAAIGRHIAALVEDGSTVQVGVGGVPEALMGFLKDHRDLALHSLLVDAGIDLIRSGAANARFNPVMPGCHELGEIMGSRALYGFVHQNRQIALRSSEIVHNPLEIARRPKFVSVNSAIQVDLTGQVNAEWIGGRQVSSVGGAFDFLTGASLSPGGKGVIGLPSTAGKNGELSRIVTRLPEGTPVTIPRYLAHHVVTEHGAANLKGLNLEDRRRALIAIAHPRHREALEKGAI
ncbi:MAG: 4-hydroxybutyrate CoA-transferase [Deltaproteobacteria bacterium]|nr:4-hydroxybutyrate CoA-transferase [Deltaproteobacteria bacterium]